MGNISLSFINHLALASLRAGGEKEDTMQHKLFTKEIEKRLQEQYKLGNNLEKQKVICKIFNPYGSWTWYILNQDKDDTDYLWAIVKGNEVEIGSISKAELENLRIKFGGYGLPLERDSGFRPINAKECYDRLLKGEHI